MLAFLLVSKLFNPRVPRLFSDIRRFLLLWAQGAICHLCHERLAVLYLQPCNNCNTNTQIRIHKYEYTNMNTQIKIHKYKYTNINCMHCGVAVGCQKKQRKWAMAAMRVTNGCTPSRAHRGKPGPHLIWQQCDTIFSLCGLSVLIQIQIQYKYIVIQVCVLSAGLWQQGYVGKYWSYPLYPQKVALYPQDWSHPLPAEIWKKYQMKQNKCTPWPKKVSFPWSVHESKIFS